MIFEIIVIGGHAILLVGLGALTYCGIRKATALERLVQSVKDAQIQPYNTRMHNITYYLLPALKRVQGALQISKDKQTARTLIREGVNALGLTSDEEESVAFTMANDTSPRLAASSLATAILDRKGNDQQLAKAFRDVMFKISADIRHGYITVNQTERLPKTRLWLKDAILHVYEHFNDDRQGLLLELLAYRIFTALDTDTSISMAASIEVASMIIEAQGNPEEVWGILEYLITTVPQVDKFDSQLSLALYNAIDDVFAGKWLGNDLPDLDNNLIAKDNETSFLQVTRRFIDYVKRCM